MKPINERKPRTRSGAKAESDWHYYEKNRDAILARTAKYRKINREKIRAAQKKYREKNKVRLRAYFKRPDVLSRKSKVRSIWNFKAKTAVLSHYGVGDKAACVVCGVNDIDMLTIDHINGGGRKHRESVCTYSSTTALYRWFIRNNFPVGFQTLCANHNLKKEIELRRGQRFRIDGGAAF